MQPQSGRCTHLQRQQPGGGDGRWGGVYPCRGGDPDWRAGQGLFAALPCSFPFFFFLPHHLGCGVLARHQVTYAPLLLLLPSSSFLLPKYLSDEQQLHQSWLIIRNAQKLESC